ASMSPLFSVSAFLHSIMPAPVRSRSSLTMDAVISIGGPRIRKWMGGGQAPAAVCVAAAPGGQPRLQPRHDGAAALPGDYPAAWASPALSALSAAPSAAADSAASTTGLAAGARRAGLAPSSANSSSRTLAAFGAAALPS